MVPAAAVAAANRDPVLQWFYEQYNDKMLDSHRKRALDRPHDDASLPSQSPEGHLPLGRAYHAQGHLVSSRSSWDSGLLRLRGLRQSPDGRPIMGTRTGVSCVSMVTG